MNFLKKIFEKFCCINKKNDDGIIHVQLEDQLKEIEPCDRFALLFEHLGGYFKRCTSEKDIKITLRSILRQENLSNAFCCEKRLQKLLSTFKFRYTENLDVKNDVALISCEYLIAFDSRIMLSYNNIKHFSTSSLPNRVVIVADTSQVVVDLNFAMMKVKRRGIPKNLTSISGNISELDFPNRKNHKLFLLLQNV